jgi:hypothetical protein
VGAPITHELILRYRRGRQDQDPGKQTRNQTCTRKDTHDFDSLSVSGTYTQLDGKEAVSGYTARTVFCLWPRLESAVNRRNGKYSTGGILQHGSLSYPEIRKGERHMARISAKAMALVAALLWGGCLLFVGLINIGAPSYGAEFLRMMSSIYPGFHDTRTWGEVILGTVYGFVDGAIAGLLFAWLVQLGNAFQRA